MHMFFYLKYSSFIMIKRRSDKMSYQLIKLIVYIVSIMMSMFGLSCFRYDHFIVKGKVKQFYMLYIILSVVLGYLLGSFILEFMTIHL